MLASPVLEASPRDDFSAAWQAASRGQRDLFEQLKPGLQDYLLYPYLQYEDLRFRRATVDEDVMAGFLDGHRDWAFTAGLETAWLRTLGARKRWEALLRHGGDSGDTVVQCHLAHARIRTGDTDGLLRVVQALWTVGESQPDACDPVFDWLRKEGGITNGLAWERIRRAMEARQPRLTLYLKRYLEPKLRDWADLWYQQDRGGYRQLRKAARWGDSLGSRDITSYGLKRLARRDAERAWDTFEALDGHINWPADTREAILREIALWSAVEGADETAQRMQAVPEARRDGQLLEWWARYDLARGNWANVLLTIAAMPAEQKDDARWRYWDARARLETGDPDHAAELLNELAQEANYYGFLAADRRNLPYTICEQEPNVPESAVDALATGSGFERALELRAVGMRNWARSEWKLATDRQDRQGLRTAAALAIREDWPDMAIIALGNSGDLRWYSWRFPVEYGPLVNAAIGGLGLDTSWIMGLMRSESAMAEDALSSAGARGLMQVMPATARQLARRHSINYTGKEQLMKAEDNIRFGTVYLEELMDRYAGNPVLASGAYNAGPHVVDRWMDERITNDPAIWVDTLPYFETRDYIPRVLAFTTLYDWRLNQPVVRVSSRMPELDSTTTGGTMKDRETAEIVCRPTGQA